MAKKVVTFGEIMLRLQTYNHERFIQMRGLEATFGGGLIYSMLQGFDGQKAIEFAVAASCLKHTIEGDMNLVTVKEVENLMGGDGSGRVQR